MMLKIQEFLSLQMVAVAVFLTYLHIVIGGTDDPQYETAYNITMNEDCFSNDTINACEPGYHLNHEGTVCDIARRCCYCPPNTYQPWWNDCYSCIACTNCSEMQKETMHHCNITHNSVCGKHFLTTTVPEVEALALGLSKHGINLFHTIKLFANPVVSTTTLKCYQSSIISLDTSIIPSSNQESFPFVSPEEVPDNPTVEDGDEDGPKEETDCGFWRGVLRYTLFHFFTHTLCLLPSILFVIIPSLPHDIHNGIKNAYEKWKNRHRRSSDRSQSGGGMGSYSHPQDD